MKHRVFATALACFGFYLFLRMPSLDTAILVWPALLVISIFSEEAWEHFKAKDSDPGPRCPQCGYDVRATPVRCPECGLLLV